MVKCSDCGFLAMHHVVSREFHSAEEEVREAGQEFGGSMERRFEDYPLCFARELDIKMEAGFGSPPGGGAMERVTRLVSPTPDDVLRVLDEDRDCPSFTTWVQGFTPKDHREIRDREHLHQLETERDTARQLWEAEQQDKALSWQADESKKNREWEAVESSKNRKWQEHQARRRLRWEVIIFAVVVTAALIIAQVASAFML